MMDDSDLLHGRVYDPVKARAYYLRTRKLKGRRPAASPDPTKDRRPGNADSQRSSGHNSEAHNQARAQAEQRLEDLLNRLDRLRNLLSERVDAAKKRSGIKDTSPSSSSTSKKSSSKSGGSSSSNSKPTAKEKRDAAERAHKSYEKNKRLKPSKAEDPSINEQIKKVEAQIHDIREKLKQATAEARKNSEAKSKNKTSSSKGRQQ